MKPEAIAIGVAGILFGLIAGWIIGTQQAAPRPSAAVEAPRPVEAAPRVAALDDAQVDALRSVAEREPSNAAPRVQLGNLYFDAEQYAEAIPWYTEALKLAPNDVDVSTDLGVAYYYTNQPDRALEQFDQSLRLDPSHAKTFLNIGVMKAFGREDLEGAEQAWQRVVDLSPDSPEGQAARRALESLRSAHPSAETAQQPGS